MDISYHIEANGKQCRFNYRVAAIIEVGGKILANKFVGDDFCFLPGGRVQIGETARDAIVRELEEELGVKAEVLGFPFIVENFFEHKGETFHEIGLFFRINGDGLQLPQDGEIHDGVLFLWKDAKGLSDANLLPAFLITALPGMSDTIKHIVHVDRSLAG